MKYLGGKTRIAKPIAEIILANMGDRRLYVEPFLGSAAVMSKVAPHVDRSIGYDVHPDLIMMWQALQMGWTPPAVVTEHDYKALQHHPHSALRGFVGFTCSYSGKWFGGYARDPKSGRNFAAEGARSVTTRAAAMRNTIISEMDYREIPFSQRMDGLTIYCDPPYANTTAYAGAGAFDSAAFWRTAEDWAKRGAQVYVSEYTAPDGWECIWAKDQAVSVGKPGMRATEKLFVYVGKA